MPPNVATRPVSPDARHTARSRPAHRPPLLILLLAAGLLAPHAATARDRVVTVTAEGAAEAEPSMAELRFEAAGAADTSAAAIDNLNGKVDAAAKAIAALALPNVAVAPGGVSLSQTGVLGPSTPAHARAPRTQVHFAARRDVLVTITGLDAAGTEKTLRAIGGVLDAAAEAGLRLRSEQAAAGMPMPRTVMMGDVTFVAPDGESAFAAARARAVAKARRQAASLANETGHTLGAVLAVRLGPDIEPSAGGMRELYARMVMGGGDTEPRRLQSSSLAPIRVTATVTVTFELQPGEE